MKTLLCAECGTIMNHIGATGVICPTCACKMVDLMIENIKLKNDLETLKALSKEDNDG